MVFLQDLIKILEENYLAVLKQNLASISRKHLQDLHMQDGFYWVVWLQSSSSKPQWFQYLKLAFLEIPNVGISLVGFPKSGHIMHFMIY